MTGKELPLKAEILNQETKLNGHQQLLPLLGPPEER